MKKKLLIIFLLSACVAVGQTNYLVYQVKGKALQTNGKRSTLQIGQVLKHDAVLWLDKGAIVTLICDNYSTFSVTTAGGYVLAKHSEICPKNENSITADYCKFIWEQLTHPHESPEDNRLKFMHNTGAVVRGCPGVLIDPLFDTINYNGDSLFISWKTGLLKERLKFVLYTDESYGDQLFSTPVKEDHMNLDTIKKYSGKRDDVYWNINVDGNEICPRKYIRFWDKSKFDLYLDSLKKLIPPNSGKAESDYITGFFLEENFFLTTALHFYQQAALTDTATFRYMRTVVDLKKKLEH